jgi:hypothetical protein
VPQAPIETRLECRAPYASDLKLINGTTERNFWSIIKINNNKIFIEQLDDYHNLLP